MASTFAMMVASGQYSVDEIKNMYAMDFEEEGLHIDSEYMDELIKVMSKHWRENKNREIERMAEIREKRKKG